MGINLCTIDDSSLSLPAYEILKEGWLYKKSSLFDSYSKKWVVISKRPHTYLLCFKDDKKKAKECTIYFRFADMEFTSLDDQGLQFAQKKGGNNQKWIFYSNDDDEYENWLKAIQYLTGENLKYLETCKNNNWTMLIIEDEIHIQNI